jgi:hypothetical protein
MKKKTKFEPRESPVLKVGKVITLTGKELNPAEITVKLTDSKGTITFMDFMEVFDVRFHTSILIDAMVKPCMDGYTLDAMNVNGEYVTQINEEVTD